MLDPELKIDETMLLAAMAKNRDIYMAVIELRIKDWFFNSKDNRLVYTEMVDIITQRTYDNYKSILLGKNNKASELFKKLMFVNCSLYEQMYREDDFMFLNMVDIHRSEAQEHNCFRITEKITECIKGGFPYQKYLAELEDLSPNTLNNDKMNADQIITALENDEYQERYPTGIEPLDNMVSLVDSTLLVIAGESSSGKTTLTNQLIYNFLKTTKYNTLYFSLETTQKRLGTRWVQHVQKIDNVDSRGARERFRGMLDRLMVTKLTTNIKDIEKMIRDEKKKDDKLMFVAVDYLQIIDVDGSRDEKERVSHATKVLHKLAQELGVLVILLSQLKKEEFTKTNGTGLRRSAPTMHDLRGSAQIANSPDYIIINWFEDVHAKKAEAREVNLQVVKNKEGEQGKVECLFIGKDLTFLERC